MVCCPYGEVSQEPFCDVNGDLKSRDVLNSKASFLEILTGTVHTPVPQSEPICGKLTIAPLTTDTVRIAGGKKAAPGDWPWMALLGYSRVGETEPSFECGGTLISGRNVLTSAHCLDKR